MGARARGGRWALALLAGLVLLLGLLWGALAWLLPYAVERALRAELAARGVDAVRIGDLQVGLRRAVVKDLVLGDEEIVAEQLRAEYALADLLRGRVATLSLAGLHARGRLGGDAAPGALGALVDGVASGTGGGDPPPFDALDLSDVRLALQTPAGEIRIAADGRLDLDDGRWLGGLELRIASEPDRLRGRARLSAQPDAQRLELGLTGEALPLGDAALDAFALSFAGDFSDGRLSGELALDAAAQTPIGPSHLTLPASLALDPATQQLRFQAVSPTPPARAAGALTFAALGLRLSGLGGTLAFGEETPRVALQAAEVRDLQDPQRFPPLSLAGDLRWGAGELRAAGTLTAADGRIALRFEGVHGLDTAEGRMQLELDPIAFAAGALQPEDLSPRLSAVAATGGRLDAEGSLAWGEAGLRSDLRLALRDLAGVANGVAFEGLEADVRLTQPWPLATPPDQRLEIARVSRGLDLTQVAVRFALQPPGVLDLASAEGRVLGGRVETAGRHDPSLDRNAFVLALSDLDLAALSRRLDVEGLDARGRVTGTIPLAIQGGEVVIEAGELAATGPGVLRYRPGAAAALPADDPSVRLLLDALRDFRYERLRITLAGAVRGELDVGVHLAGSSPDFYEGHPVEFNLNLEAPVAALLQDLEVEALPERILRGLRQSGGPAR